MYCNACSLDMQYVVTREKDDQLWDFFICTVCNTPAHQIRYKYTPHDCPTVNGRKHQWGYVGTEFKDDRNVHTIFQVDRCDKCGAVRRTPRDLRQAGLSGRVEVDDPRVTPHLLPNKSSFERFAPVEVREEARGEFPEDAILPREEAL